MPNLPASPEHSTQVDRVANRLHSAAIHLLRGLRVEDTLSGLTAPRMSVLSVLVFAGPRTLGELAAAEQVRRPTMTRLIQGLEKDGLVRRQADPTDGRVSRMHATAKGRALLLEGRARRVAALRKRLEGLSPRDLDTLDRATELMERAVREPA